MMKKTCVQEIMVFQTCTNKRDCYPQDPSGGFGWVPPKKTYYVVEISKGSTSSVQFDKKSFLGGKSTESEGSQLRGNPNEQKGTPENPRYSSSPEKYDPSCGKVVFCSVQTHQKTLSSSLQVSTLVHVFGCGLRTKHPMLNMWR